MTRLSPLLALALCATVSAPASAQSGERSCLEWKPESLRRNPTEPELRCRYHAHGPGRFGLLSYVDVPVYQPATPMPGTHVVGVVGHARPRPWESYEEWEWRVLRTEYGPEVMKVHRGLELLHPFVGSRIMALEDRLVQEGIHFRRRETWRSPERQEYLFQRGRSRPGALATGTLTSWHSQVDAQGIPAGRAVDYDVPASQMRRFHEVVASVGLSSFGHDSFDPGHVFLPDEAALAALEVAVLRVLPRVPEVTLATGLPVDRTLPPGGRETLRQAAREFASFPFIGHPSAMPRRPMPHAEPILSLTRQSVASGEAQEPGQPVLVCAALARSCP
jgi:hypothetical protein